MPEAHYDAFIYRTIWLLAIQVLLQRGRRPNETGTVQKRTPRRARKKVPPQGEDARRVEEGSPEDERVGTKVAQEQNGRPTLCMEDKRLHKKAKRGSS
jgi:hypothetical protein